MVTKYVQLSGDTTKVITAYTAPQPVTSDKPGYTTIDDSDERWTAFQNVVNGLKYFNEALSAGIQIVSTADSDLNATYSIDQVTQQNITATALYIQTTALEGSSSAKFPSGGSTGTWLDAAGVAHTFTTEEFITFAKAVAEYVSDLNFALAATKAGTAWFAPSQPITIP